MPGLQGQQSRHKYRKIENEPLNFLEEDSITGCGFLMISGSVEPDHIGSLDEKEDLISIRTRHTRKSSRKASKKSKSRKYKECDEKPEDSEDVKYTR